MELTELVELAEKERNNQKSIRIHCCTSTGCQASESLEVKKAMEDALKESGLEADVQIVGVGCMGFCGRGPMVEVEPNGIHYEKVTPEDAPSIIEALKGGEAKPVQGDPNHPFFSRQLKIVREFSGKIDPEKIGEYIAVGGYRALHHVIYDLTPEEVVAEITKSGLRGRGGAGYPTGLKWATVAKMPPGQKYVICNADEGDPGAFMDRSVLESDPHRILEGMAIAGYAVGATQGYIYVRAEYPLAITRLQKAIQQAKRQSMLGSRIFGSSINFNIDIRVGAGAFVCGEETALIASIGGGRGNPRPRPPYPAVSGLWDCPTLINNVETLGNIAPIIRNGADWYNQIGTEKSKGTKIFSLTGKIRNNGLIEVPMGITLREIVEEMGGGIPGGLQVKAVQTGGPSGGCIPAQFLDTPVDYESLTKLGSMMGSGGMVVMDENTSMVQVAQFYMEFCRGETCGKCIPCRVGTVQMYQLLTKLLNKQATPADLEKLKQLCDMVRATSLCGLGMTAPNPVTSTLQYFESEYLELLQTTNAKVAVH
ncbi:MULTISPECIES: NuoF family protein [Arthrospira]|jgi:bidirectional [NiFe] hydrogenase diaphorase subunit|uniref:Diaphorase subunit of the bidirectional hydrogenase n=1 Tax=Limnospira platensis NIES-46 TaxID=1236695 RepID=A0A5M3T5S9_LIMPL|nr:MULTISPECIES: NuoF family protein [Arthrospira]AMW30008.1 NADH dehydrogenase [Arthrospira platensis YZ]KDR53940.1 NADH dehydrogenase [Arthrospira platensis str. Paraca]MBD2670874.1 NAD(P)H-dependent oxidoreductase subunit E [Arthrospira platensis FACHB-439]MBD2712990.1 NAD(P)H-dependent oxidoreductase subunit E [Arthrospira platensis FACHB-835]MDF2211934.1 NADH-ubiquinone oxidoreductase-F iron-sulfur binding region domain-containing protein [Arthrospira platensis NCB002]MDT9296367.1 NADH-u